MHLLQEAGWVPCWIPHLVVQMLMTTMEIVVRLVVVASLVTVESLSIVGSLVIVESLVIVDRLVVNVRLVMLESLVQDLRWNQNSQCLERINCEGWNSSFKICSEHGLLFFLLVHGISCALFIRCGDIGVDLFWFSKKLFFDSFTVFWFF